MDGYCYGDNDLADRALLDFLKLDDATVLRVVEAIRSTKRQPAS